MSKNVKNTEHNRV